MFSLKIDSATRLCRSFLAVNVQYIDKNEIVIKTLAIKLKERHSAQYIKNIILKILSIYDFNPDQIYSITCDNGRNMIKAAEILNEYVDIDVNDDNESDISITEIGEDDIVELLTVDKKSKFLVNIIRCAAHTIQLAVHDVLKINEVMKNIGILQNVATTLRTPNHRSKLNVQN